MELPSVLYSLPVESVMPAGLLECAEVALVLRGLFGGLGLETVVKTSGSKGLQVYVPLNSGAEYSQTRPFAKQVAEALEAQMPELVVSRMTKRLRPGKVLVDWSQNDAHKTTVNVYSVRARERPTVSTPLRWEEVERCRDSGDAQLLEFDTADVLLRVEEHGDLFAAASRYHLERTGEAVEFLRAQHRAVVIHQGKNRGMLAEVVSETDRLAGVVDKLRIHRELLIQTLRHSDLLQDLRQPVAGVFAGLLISIA